MQRTAESRARTRFLARHPKAWLYAGFADFSFWRTEIAGGHLNGGFARAMALTAEQLGTALEGADELLAAEERAIEHMNADHREALALYARARRRPPGGRASGLDPEGLDLTAGNRTARLVLPERVTTAAALRTTLKDLADQARQGQSRPAPQTPGG